MIVCSVLKSRFQLVGKFKAFFSLVGTVGGSWFGDPD
jgi:hypothetical protein